MTPFPPPGVPFGASLWTAARLMPLFAKRARLDRLLALATPEDGKCGYTQMGVSEIANAVKAVVARPWRMRGRRCLREGLLAFRYLALAGHRPVLHFGLVPGSLKTEKVSAHCWISVDGEIVLNAPQEAMTQLFAYDGTWPISVRGTDLPDVRDQGAS